MPFPPLTDLLLSCSCPLAIRFLPGFGIECLGRKGKGRPRFLNNTHHPEVQVFGHFKEFSIISDVDVGKDFQVKESDEWKTSE